MDKATERAAKRMLEKGREEKAASMSNLNDPNKVNELLEVLLYVAANPNRKLKITPQQDGPVVLSSGPMSRSFNIDLDVSSGNWFLES